MKKFMGDSNVYVFNPPRTINLIAKFKKVLRKILSIMKLSKKIIIHYNVDEIYPKGLKEYVKKIDMEKNFDVIWVEYVWYSKILSYFDNKKIKVIDTHDVFSNREQVFIKNNEEPKWLYTTEKQEKKGLLRADYVVAIQDNERKFFDKLVENKTSVVTVGNSIEIKNSELPKNKKYIFVGSNNDLNINAVKYFINNILDKIREKEKESEFCIVGSVCNCIPDSEKYVKLGYVEDLGEVYKNARLVINPIQSGTGLNIKTIEALGYGKPLITTECGAKGLEKYKNAYMIAFDDDDFSKKVLDLLNNDKLAKELSVSAIKVVEDYNKECLNTLNKILQ